MNAFFAGANLVLAIVFLAEGRLGYAALNGIVGLFSGATAVYLWAAKR